MSGIRLAIASSETQTPSDAVSAAVIDPATALTLEQDNNGSEQPARHSPQNWEQVLETLNKVVERGE